MVDLAQNPEAQDAYWAAAVLRTEAGALGGLPGKRRSNDAFYPKLARESLPDDEANSFLRFFLLKLRKWEKNKLPK